MACGGFTLYTGQRTVPTSGLEVGGTYDGPGADLVANPATPPFAATGIVETLPAPAVETVVPAPVQPEGVTDEQAQAQVQA